MLLMQARENGVVLDEELLLFLAGVQDNTVDEDVDEPLIQDLELNVDNVFQADECDGFNSDVDEAPTAHTMFMANLSSVYLAYDAAGPSYDSDILFEVHDRDNYQDAICEHHEVHEIHEDVQPNCVVASNTEYTGDSNMILYDQYVKDNVKPVVQNNVLTKEIKEMKEIFKALEAEVDQNAVNGKCDEIEQKNLPIANDNLIVDCLSKKVFYIALNSELTVSRFVEIHDAHTIVQTRCLELEAELSKLNAKIQKDGHNELVKHFSNLEKSVETLREIVEEARVERPLDRPLTSACLYTKHSQKLLEYVVGTCPKDFNKQDKKQTTTLFNRKKQVTFEDQCET
nr:retrovirus-related Pol polyprotein from transposon TNT 1-94 [Tanacetum cinerariifolium]